MNYLQRHNELNAQFKLGTDTRIKDTECCIRFFPFHSGQEENTNIISEDNTIQENFSFQYPVFVPKKTTRCNAAILLLHGLNERNWNKYLTWAEYLCNRTGKAVILFPIAYHINRSPMWWCNPRATKELIDTRNRQNGADRSLCFANVAFSERISENPYRFYSSGRQSFFDVVQLIETVKQGKHPLFTENAQIDFFSYSIGAFLSQITFMTNPKNLLSDSKLFMFCGGSIFSAMVGISRCIMDKKAFEILFNYYVSDFEKKEISASSDKLFNVFCSMISPNRNKEMRTSFFKQLGDRIAGISLKTDKVIPYTGIKEALGSITAEKRIKLTDFDFPYTHENPFPVTGNVNHNAVSHSFQTVFAEAAEFLA